MARGAYLADQDDGRRRDVKINLRAPAQTKDLIESAARVVGKTLTDFVLDSAKRRAEEVLLDQRFFALDDAKFAAFMSVLDCAPAPSEELRKLLLDKAPWEK
jgi:uncharacterized protein (DUF1778 family)